MDKLTVAMLGTGTMGRALGSGLLRAGVVGPEGIRGTVKHATEVEEALAEVTFPVDTDNVAAASGADVLLLCTKPRGAAALVKELAAAGALDHDPLLISIAAGVATATLEARNS